MGQLDIDSLATFQKAARAARGPDIGPATGSGASEPDLVEPVRHYVKEFLNICYSPLEGLRLPHLENHNSRLSYS